MRRTNRALFAAAFLIVAGRIGLGALPNQTAQGHRGLLPTDAPAEQKPVGKYYALVIGNDEYRHLTKLQTAVSDAREVSQILHDRFGFHTKVLYNATRAQILDKIDSYRALPVDSNLLLYYAGHGYRDKDTDRAYWLPVDANGDKRPNWINSTDITDGIHAIKSRHILVISDSCFSGDLVLRDAMAAIASGGHNALIAKALSLSSRHIMSSGGDEPVADSGPGGHSVFAAALLESLNDMRDDVFRGNDLFDKVKRRVEMRSQANQTPQYDILRDSFADLGDFVFFRSKRRGTVSGIIPADQPSNATNSASAKPAVPHAEAASPDKKVLSKLAAQQFGNAPTSNPTVPTAVTPSSEGHAVSSRFLLECAAGAETVTDTNTGLMWMRNDYVNLEKTFVTNWNEAMDWAKKLNAAAYGGYSDWVVPTIVQYRTINSNKGDRAEYLRVFQKTAATDFWASNTPSQSVASYISFTDGSAVSGEKTDPALYKYLGRTETYPISVRLVRVAHAK